MRQRNRPGEPRSPRRAAWALVLVAGLVGVLMPAVPAAAHVGRFVYASGVQSWSYAGLGEVRFTEARFDADKVSVRWELDAPAAAGGLKYAWLAAEPGAYPHRCMPMARVNLSYGAGATSGWLTKATTCANPTELIISQYQFDVSPPQAIPTTVLAESGSPFAPLAFVSVEMTNHPTTQDLSSHVVVRFNRELTPGAYSLDLVRRRDGVRVNGADPSVPTDTLSILMGGPDREPTEYEVRVVNPSDRSQVYLVSGTFVRYRKQWAITMDTSGATAIATANQMPSGLTSAMYRIHVYENGVWKRSCTTTVTCAWNKSAGNAYLATVANGARQDIQADSNGFSFDPLLGASPADFNRGGGNPAANEQPCQEADPVDCSTGALTETVADLVLPGRSPAAASRSYDSLSLDPGWFGRGWRSPLDLAAEIAHPAAADAGLYGAYVLVRQENGAGALFTRTGVSGSTSLYTPAPAVRGALAHIPNGAGRADDQYRFTRGDGTVMLFGSDGRVQSVAGADGEATAFAFGAMSITQTTADGRALVFALAPGGSTVASVAGPLGRAVSYGYGASGDLTSVVDPEGHTWSYGYDPGHRLTSMTDPTGRTTANAYDASSRVVAQTAPGGATTAFTYTGSGHDLQTTMTDPDGRTTAWSYQRGLLAARAMDPSGLNAVERYAHDAAGNLATSTDATGLSSTSTYDSSGRQLSATNAAGDTTTVAYTPAGLPSAITTADGLTTTLAYNADGQLVSRTTPGAGGAVTTAYAYDPAHRGDVVATATPLGTQTRAFTPEGFPASTADATGRTESTTYNAYGQPLTSTSASGGVTTYAYTPGGRLASTTGPTRTTTAFGYDDAGRPTATVDPGGGVWATSYDTAGRVWRETDPLGGTTTHGYDAAGNPTSTTDPDGNTDTTSYDALSRVSSTTTASGATTAFAYDLAGRPLSASTADPAHPGQSLTTATAYDPAGRVASTTDAAGLTTAFAYGAAGRLATATWPGGAATTYGYDTAGRITSQATTGAGTQTRVFDAYGRLTGSTDAAGGTTTTSYDAAGRVLETVPAAGNAPGADPDAHATVRAYDAGGRLASATGPLGAATLYSYDAADRLLSVADPLGRATTTTYDPRGLPVRQVATDGAATTLAYDAAGRLVRTVAPLGNAPGADPDAHATLLAYTPASRLASTTDPLGRTTTRAYLHGRLAATGNALGTTAITADALGRTVSVGYSDATPGVSYGHDTAGRVATITDAAGTKTLAYDAAGRLASATRPSGAWAYTYDAPGRVTGRTRPGGIAETVTRDAAGRATAVGYGPAAAAMAYTYDPDGRVASAEATGAGFKEAYGYDAAGRVSSVTTLAKDPAGAWQAAASYTVARDAAGNPTAVTAARAGVSESRGYLYDARDRLAGVCHAAGPCTPAAADESYAWDLDGNLAQATVAGVTTTYAHDAAGQLTSSTDGQSSRAYAHDAAGRLLSDGSNTYTYGLDGALASHTYGGATTTYVTDSAGLRVSAARAGATTAYTWDDSHPIPALVGVGGVDLFTGPNAQTTYQATSGASRELLGHDWLSSVTAVLAGGGAAPTQTAAFDYTGLGSPRAPAGGAGAAATISTLGFAGLRAAGNGVLHARARDLDPALGRFTSPDPLGGGYTYVEGRTTAATDPQGLCALTTFGADDSCLPSVASALTPVGWAAAGLAHAFPDAGGSALHDSLLVPLAFADSYTGGLSRAARANLGLDGAVNYCSPGYTNQWAHILGATAALAGGGGAVKAAAALLRAKRAEQATRAALATRATTAANTGSSLIGKTYGLGEVIENPGLTIKGFQGAKTPGHALNQIINRGISPSTLRETVANPTVVLRQGSGNYLYLSQEAAVAMRADGQVVTAYGRADFRPHILDILADAG